MPENRLARETSPYLRQHKDNPVDWYPWGAEALETAKRENKPILLSVGYAACHWCHVMAHESFESAEIAALMNDNFINIKVDREERPDIDSLYQTALALLGQQGGWPLTMFVTPDGAPFWGGTYFPARPQWGRPGFPQVLQKISEIYKTEPDVVAENESRLKEAMTGLYRAEAASGDVSPELIGTTAQQFLAHVDWTNGGTGGAPKFPQPPILNFLWRVYKRDGNNRCRDAVLLTLEKMSEGGIYDHLGGGYARYAVDDRWLVPHFEKMLYDNGQILGLLLDAWRETANPLFRARIYETVDWLLREMRVEGDAFSASFDADSEGEEGKYYVWQEPEVDDLLGDTAPLFKEVYDVTPSGNWEGKSILNRLSLDRELTEAEERQLAEARQRLFAARQGRVPPARDDKVLADWNGLVIGPLAEAAMAFGETAWLTAAEAAYDYISSSMTREIDGQSRLAHSLCAGKRLESDVVDDYANMAASALALFEATQENRYLSAAQGWTATARALFEDETYGGFYLSPEDAEDVFLRARSAMDHATPNANGILTQVFAKLYHFTHNETYRTAAEKTVRAFGGAMQQQALGCASLLSGLVDILDSPQIVVIGADAELDIWRQALFNLSIPGRSIRLVESIDALPQAHPARYYADRIHQTTAFVCRGQQCSLPITEVAKLPEELSPR